jgi:hypothetical protein
MKVDVREGLVPLSVRLERDRTNALLFLFSLNKEKRDELRRKKKKSNEVKYMRNKT